MREKFCSRCGKEKEEKYRHQGSYCKTCAVERVREYEKNNPEKVKALQEKYRIKKQTQKCKICKCTFLRKRGEICCSVKCKLINLKTINKNGCWIYPYVNGRKYGSFALHGVKELAHRASFRSFNGEIPPNMFVCHKCDNPSCFNPEHLFLGTCKQNIQDAIAKGRAKHIGRKGNVDGWTKLNLIQIDEMRKLYDEGFNIMRLSKIFNCSKDYISKIIKFKARF